MNIVVLAGGLSPERDVSLTSGSLIANALIRKGHKVLLLDVYEGKRPDKNCTNDGSFDRESGLKLFSDKPYPIYSVKESEPDLKELARRFGNRRAKIGENVLFLCRLADTVFISLHGDMGENGQLQATFDCFGIKYTGSGYIGSLLAMDKDLSKKMLRGAKIDTPDWICVDTSKCNTADTVAEVEQKIGFPCVVKPVSCGSSVGISMVDGAAELRYALDSASRYGDSVLIEKKISGREFTVGYFDGRVLPPVEIIPKSGFYDYKNKYQSGLTEEICPAQISDEEWRELSKITARAFECLKLKGYARFDFIMQEGEDSKKKYMCLEANTLPGMTPTSLLPQEAAAVGIDYDTLCDKIARMPIR